MTDSQPQPQYQLVSMTGYGRAQATTGLGDFTVELRTVNNRFADINVALPREISLIESNVRAFLKGRIPRGKIDCRIQFRAGEGVRPDVRVNEPLAQSYIQALDALRKMGAHGEPNLELVSRMPGVLDVGAAELDPEELFAALQPVVESAIEALETERGREGAALARQFADLSTRMRELAVAIEPHRAAVVERYRDRLRARIAELEDELKTKADPGRLEMEVAVFADRSDIAEELTRLAAHLDRLDAALTDPSPEPRGKSLDFLIQELHREVNTLCSKSRDTVILDPALEMKSCIEKMREQVQNIQ